MTLWQDVVITALVGTERQPFQLTPSADQLGNLLSQLDTADPEGALLSAAAAISLYQRAGQLPVKDDQPLPKPCELDDLPCCSPGAGQQLNLMLLGQYPELLPEWLAKVASAGQRVLDEYLPALLEKGQKSPQLRDAILAVLGKRGRWLAAQNPSLDYVVDEDIEETWTTGSRAARQLLVQRLRAENPTAARERVAANWEQEDADQRAALITTFRIGLSMEDEPFLEAALDDRRNEVRRTAVSLLARLSDSRLCQRMIERTRSSLKLTQKQRNYHLEVTLPESCTSAMQRDGVESKPSQGRGEKAWWFQQMLSAVPPAVWCETWGIPKNSLKLVLQAALASEWEQVLLEGWITATQRHQDADWAEVLLAAWPQRISDQQLKRLLEALSAERREAFILSLLQGNQKPLNNRHPGWQLLRDYKQPLGKDLSRAVLNSFRRYLENNNVGYDWELRSTFKQFAYYMEPSLVQEVMASLTQLVKGQYLWKEAADEFLGILQFRNQIIKEF